MEERRKKGQKLCLQAVINEDTQGNVAHLQTEIRRLRDMLSQFQSGSVPHPLPFNAAGGDMGADSLPLDAGEWRNKFLEAMLFREKSEQEQEVKSSYILLSCLSLLFLLAGFVCVCVCVCVRACMCVCNLIDQILTW